MKKVTLGVLLTAGLLGFGGIANAMPIKHISVANVICFSESRVNLGKVMRSLWEDHVIYTRNYIISSLANLPDTDAVAQRLLKNQDDIGNAIKPFYGNAAGNKLTTLLREHILIAAEVVKAAKSNDSAALKTSQQKWKDNADELATFLSSANPNNWTKQDIQSMLYTHLDLTTGEVVSRLNKDWKKDIAYFDKGEKHMLMFSDMLSDGIEKQFSNKFK